MRFYSQFAYICCGHGCNSKLQALTYTEEEYPLDMDWPEMQRILDLHCANCSVETPYTEDSNAFYGNPDDCYKEPGYCIY
jgi:hypothetical protein